MKSIDEHIKKDQSEIEAARASGDEAKVRHLTEEGGKYRVLYKYRACVV